MYIKSSAISFSLAFLVSVSKSSAALTVTISGEVGATLVNVGLSGTLSLPGATPGQLPVMTNLISIPQPINGGMRGLGGNQGSIATPFAVSPQLVEAGELGPSANVATATYFTGGGTFSADIHNITYSNTGFYGLLTETDYTYPGAAIAAGDILEFAGGFDLSLSGGATFDTRFVPGTHVGGYNGNDIIFNVVTVPEPSTPILFGIAAGALVFGRRRR